MKRVWKVSSASILSILFIWGCAGKTNNLTVKDTILDSPESRQNISPNGINIDEDSKDQDLSSRMNSQEKETLVEKNTFTNSLGMEFAYIRRGIFTMGSSPHEYGRDEMERQHNVILSQGFFLQTTEVTQKQWKTIMGDNPSYFQNIKSITQISHKEGHRTYLAVHIVLQHTRWHH